MVSFKLAAIKILNEANKPLHYEEITRLALEKGLIETSGSTPENSMVARISTDIKYKKDKSAFVQISSGTYELNKKRYLEEEKEEEKEEKENLEEKKETISTQYIGSAGEHRVVSELLFRGYNSSLMSVDDGIDISAIKENSLFNIQVKTANLNKYNSYVFDIRASSFEKYNSGNTYYIFVLRGDETNFLIIPYNEMKKYIDLDFIKKVNKDTRYRVNVRVRGKKYFFGLKENDVSYYLNRWDLI